MTDAPILESSRGWLRSLTRLLLLRRPEAVPALLDSRWLGVLALLGLGTWIAVDWLREQPDPGFFIYNFPDVAWYALLTLGLSRVLARWSRPEPEFGRTLAFVLAVAPLVIVALYLIQFHVESTWGSLVATIGLCAYLVVYVSKCLHALSGTWQWRAVALGAVFVAGSLSITHTLFVDPSLWYAESDESAQPLLPTDAEELLFSQSQRIDDSVSRMAPSDATAPSAFFVGFAGFADQRVFAEEIKLAARTIGQRYGSTNRSLFLINDRRSLDQAPLANPTALEYALQAVAGRMNPDKDVLFLALSSHGSHEGTVSVSNGALPFHDLSANDLASYLKASGIKWRVVVVSACYSGTFVEPLLSSGTAVITAAAADRTSFGCADDRDLTYFGEAFYRDALPKATSLRDAFEKAKAAIASREKAEGVDPSQPQAFFGKEIETRVDALRKTSFDGR